MQGEAFLSQKTGKIEKNNKDHFYIALEQKYV